MAHNRMYSLHARPLPARARLFVGVNQRTADAVQPLVVAAVERLGLLLDVDERAHLRQAGEVPLAAGAALVLAASRLVPLDPEPDLGFGRIVASETDLRIC